MNVLVVDYAGHPFQFDLASELADCGHHVVHTYCSSTVAPQASFTPRASLRIVPVSLGHDFSKYNITRRIFDELQYGRLTIRAVRGTRFDRVITSNVPLLSLFMVYIWARVRRVRWTLWLQDIQSGLAGLVIGRRSVAERLLRMLEHFLMRRAHTVVAISEGFAHELVRIGVSASRIHTIGNWAPLHELPVRAKSNSWSRSRQLDEKFVFLYSGTLGKKHSPEMLLALADEFVAESPVSIVVVAEGAGADWLDEQLAQHPRPNILRLPFQPFEDLPDVLASADVLVSLLDPAAGMFSVPSKTLTYLCAERALLVAVPAANEVATLVATRARAGLVTPPGDGLALATAGRRLYTDGVLRSEFARSARRYAELTFGRRRIGSQFCRALDLAGTNSENYNG